MLGRYKAGELLPWHSQYGCGFGTNLASAATKGAVNHTLVSGKMRCNQRYQACLTPMNEANKAVSKL